MAITAITLLDNRSSAVVRLLDMENTSVPGHNVPVAPGQSLAVNMWVPWADNSGQFPSKHLELQLGSATRFWIWQNLTWEDGDHVRFSMDGAWHDHGRPVHGVSVTAGDRTIVVRDGGFELTAFPSGLAATIRTALGSGGYHLSGQFGDRPVPSMPKSSAAAFSMAGPPSDALAHGQPGARFMYRDEGKRYRFELRNGVAVAIHPDGTQTPLTAAVSFHNTRAGENIAAPLFDLIAANGGRVFAKEQGVDRFYFTTMDQMMVGAADDGHEIAIPSIYFKFDPQFNRPGAMTGDLTAPFEGAFGGHPGADRFALFQFALAQNLLDMMMVRLRPRTWHLADVRPPLGTFNLEMLAIKTIIDNTDLLVLASSPQFKAMLALVEQAVIAPDISPPSGIPSYRSVTYAIGSDSVSSWLDPVDQHVVHASADGHIHELFYTLGTGPWGHGDLTAATGAPPAAGAVTSWLDPVDQHVAYASADGHIHELFYTLGKGPWGHGDLTAATGAPPAAGAVTSWVDRTFQHVVYASADGHVHELYYTLGTGPWAHGDLTAATGAPPAAGAVTSSVNATFQQVAYIAADGHVHELSYRLGTGPWAHSDLTAVTGAPAACAATLTSWVDAAYKHVAYVAADGHVHELYYALGTGPWGHGDLTAATGAPPAAGALTSWVDARYQHVAYVAADGHVHELYYALGTGPWGHGDLTAMTGAPAAAGGVTSWVDAVDQHVAYIAADGHVHELFYTLGTGPWGHGDLTAATGAPIASVPFNMPSIDFDQVLDIGVGHTHWHEQYESVTGGEMQPMRTGPITGPPLPPITYADLYRFANGPVRDSDGYIDGTCNYYALVHLRGPGDKYALLYIDEQSYFVQRWRMVDPLDANGAMALASALRSNAALYGWDPNKYWCPFRAGQITAKSRLAVSRQVILVSAPDLTNTDPAHPTAVIYSTNFSYNTMDRSWRWRKLPGQAEYFTSDDQRRNEPIDASLPNRIYPETVRLREDMTIHVKGTQQRPDGSIVAGRWHQPYLPPGNQLTPPSSLLTGSRPADPYMHAWQFLPEPVFQAADHFSHLGVYDAVDARTQYYTLTPASAADAQALAGAQRDPAPWVEGGHRLCTRLLEFQWAAPLRVPDVDPIMTTWSMHIVGPPKSPPSLFNPDTRLRIAKRGADWIAVPWDKRDDDLIPFDGLPVTVTLTKGASSATVTLQANTWAERPPAVGGAFLTWTGDPQHPVLIALGGRANVWRVRMAALDPVPDPSQPAQPATVVPLLDMELGVRFAAGSDGIYRLSWAPPANLQAALAKYCTADGALAHGTSIWFEDMVGHVSLPGALGFTGRPPALSANGHLWHTIRQPDGSWAAADDVNRLITVPGPVTAVAAASSAAGQAQFAFATADGRLWHTIRQPDGTWSGSHDVKDHFGDPGVVIAVAAVSLAPNVAEFVFATADGGLWHSVRRPDGTWMGLGDLKAQFGDPGAVVAVATASTVAGEVQFVLATADGSLWHGIRRADGTWTGLADVKGQIGDPGVVVAVAAAGAAPQLAQFLFATADGALWHTTRQPDGTWTRMLDVKAQTGNTGSVVAVAAAATGPDYTQFVFATSGGGLWHTIRQPGGTWTAAANVKNTLGDMGAISAVAATSSASGQAQYAFS